MKIPFKVSARTARLIGRENVATSKGAVIELVKNGYDADSRYSIIFIDNELSVYNDVLSESTYEKLLTMGAQPTLLSNVYEKKDAGYHKRLKVTDCDIQELIRFQQSLSCLYIIDCGEGMTREIIEKYWMTIGTDNKSKNYITRNGRIKAGAKGIGRFALDKLGSHCEMYTIFDPTVHTESYDHVYRGYKWNVDWNDFEGDFKTIDNIGADLEGLNLSYLECVEKCGFPNQIYSLLESSKAEHGTILKITGLRDIWDKHFVSQLFDDLGVLVPPSEGEDYSIYLFDTLSPGDYGHVDSAFCDDFDYKIVAHADPDQSVDIRIYRNEYDVESIPQSFFNRVNQQNPRFSKEAFLRGYWDTTRTFAQLVPGYKQMDVTQILSTIGAFDFTFYYMKRTSSAKEDARFFYRRCPYNLRVSWLDKFGGIKLFRDGFRVRPYGERGDSAFDWLGLGARKQKSPAGVAKKEGGYKVEVENVAGAICISRLTNVSFDDKSSREGLQENQTFFVFKSILQGIIEIFEEDRATIARELDADDKERNGEAREREQAEQLAKAILERRKEQPHINIEPDDTHYQSMYLLAALNEQKDQEIEQLREEQKVLRALASSGLMLASFSHDLSKLNISMNNRYEKIKSLFMSKLSVDAFQDVEDRKNPYVLLDRAKRTDEKMQNWLNFSIGIIRKDKRRRRDVDMAQYFDGLNMTWNSIFESRGITLNVTGVSGLSLRAFEIDFDSIFYNLFSNSIEAFSRMKEERPRNIDISFRLTEKEVICEYRDSGPGLTDDIVNPNDILKPLFTTKRNSLTGEAIGTGLGMWIVKLIADDNDSKINILNPSQGFGMQIIFPIKYLHKD